MHLGISYALPRVPSGPHDAAPHTRSRLRRGKYYDGTLTAYAECVTSKLTIHDAMLAHGTSGASLLWSGGAVEGSGVFEARA